FLKKLKIKLLHDSIIALLGIYSEYTKMLIQKDTCTPMFLAVLSAKLWKEPKCPSTDDWIKKMWHMYTMDYYLAIKKNEISSFARTWKELECIVLSEVSQRKEN
ncbi:LORF2 protein, partial [Crocuta crocuta]